MRQCFRTDSSFTHQISTLDPIVARIHTTCAASTATSAPATIAAFSSGPCAARRRSSDRWREDPATRRCGTAYEAL